MKEIIIIGAGGFGREIKCLIEDINDSNSSTNYNILGFVDDGIEKYTPIQNLKVLGGIDYLNDLKVKPLLAFGIGDPKIKKRIFDTLKSNFIFPTIIHPSVSLSGYNINIGKGCVICKGTQLTCDIFISDFVTLNLSCTVGHDTKIEIFSSFMPSVNISGEVVIKKGVYVGTGAKIINQVEIGENTIIGAGAVVSKSLPNDCTAVGIPAKPIKFHKNNE